MTNADRVREDLRSLVEMDTQTAAELVHGYWKEHVQIISGAMENVSSIDDRCPAMKAVTGTAVLIAQKDSSDKEGEGLFLILGGHGAMARLVEELWDKAPEAFEQVALKKGYSKGC